MNIVKFGESKMKLNYAVEDREKLQKVMIKTFQNEMQTLSPDFQSILIDDMITAFYNRLDVLKKNQFRH